MNYLISPEDYKRLNSSRYIHLMMRLLNLLNDRNSPVGIVKQAVVADYNMKGIIPQERCSKLKEKYVFEIKKVRRVYYIGNGYSIPLFYDLALAQAEIRRAIVR